MDASRYHRSFLREPLRSSFVLGDRSIFYRSTLVHLLPLHQNSRAQVHTFVLRNMRSWIPQELNLCSRETSDCVVLVRWPSARNNNSGKFGPIHCPSIDCRRLYKSSSPIVLLHNSFLPCTCDTDCLPPNTLFPWEVLSFRVLVHQQLLAGYNSGSTLTRWKRPLRLWRHTTPSRRL